MGIITDDKSVQWGAVKLANELEKLPCPSCGCEPKLHKIETCKLAAALCIIKGWQMFDSVNRTEEVLNQAEYTEDDDAGDDSGEFFL